MTGSISNIVILTLFLGLGALALVGGVVRLAKNRYAAVRTVHAIIIDKHKVETFSKYSGTGKRERYVIVFSVSGKKKAFYVSQFSYHGYRVGQAGQLTYKGDKLIEFCKTRNP